MSLAERLKQARTPVKTKFETWINTLEPADHDALMAAANDRGLSNIAIVRACADSGYRPDKDTISEWRRSLGFTGR